MSTRDVPAESIHPKTRMGSVALTVGDLKRSLAFYEQTIGFRRLDDGNGAAELGSGDQPLLRLVEQPGAKPQPEYSTGLYHVAILLPSRPDLARTIKHIAESGYPLQGAADHLVSEAFYLADPDGNGLEIYRDRPRSEWHWNGQTVQMASDPIDLDGMFAEIANDSRPWTGLPALSQIGHVHLRVGDVRKAIDFYHGVLGFDLTAQMPSAAFFSAGGYHHHLGANSWQSRGAPPPPPDSVGMREYSVVLPDTAEQDRIEARLRAAGVEFAREDGKLTLYDPWRNRIVMEAESA
jgi:catechol 2,3-dioxygenase